MSSHSQGPPEAGWTPAQAGLLHGGSLPPLVGSLSPRQTHILPLLVPEPGLLTPGTDKEPSQTKPFPAIPCSSAARPARPQHLPSLHMSPVATPVPCILGQSLGDTSLPMGHEQVLEGSWLQVQSTSTSRQLGTHPLLKLVPSLLERAHSTPSSPQGWAQSPSPISWAGRSLTPRTHSSQDPTSGSS